MAARADRVDPLHVVAVDETALSADVTVEARPDRDKRFATHVQDAHIEAHSLDASRLVRVAVRIAAGVRSGEVRILTKAEVVQLLQLGIARGDIREKHLHATVKAALAAAAGGS